MSKTKRDDQHFKCTPIITSSPSFPVMVQQEMQIHSRHFTDDQTLCILSTLGGGDAFYEKTKVVGLFFPAPSSISLEIYNLDILAFNKRMQELQTFTERRAVIYKILLQQF
jgi:phage-related protein